MQVQLKTKWGFKMATAQDVIRIATAEVGYYAPDDPEAGSKYGRWLAEKTGEDWLAGPSWEIAWCCCFVSWCLDQAGQECTGFPSYNTDLVLSKNPHLVSRVEIQPGDIIIWDWNGDGATDHIGIVSYYDHANYIQTIEGNHHNKVAVVDRSNAWGYVAAIIRPPYTDAKPEAPDANASKDYIDEVAQMVMDGEFGNGQDRIDRLYDAVQTTVNQLCSGELDSKTDNVWIKFANDVISGDYGNEPDRRYNIYRAVQNRVNEYYA